MKTQKTTTTLATIAVATLLLSGCGGPSEQASVDTEQASSGAKQVSLDTEQARIGEQKYTLSVETSDESCVTDAAVEKQVALDDGSTPQPKDLTVDELTFGFKEGSNAVLIEWVMLYTNPNEFAATNPQFRVIFRDDRGCILGDDDNEVLIDDVQADDVGAGQSSVRSSTTFYAAGIPASMEVEFIGAEFVTDDEQVNGFSEVIANNIVTRPWVQSDGNGVRNDYFVTGEVPNPGPVSNPLALPISSSMSIQLLYRDASGQIIGYGGGREALYHDASGRTLTDGLVAGDFLPFEIGAWSKTPAPTSVEVFVKYEPDN